MKKPNKNTIAFLNLVKAGLWERDIRLKSLECVDYAVIQRLAKEQSVEGLITAGVEHVVDVKIPQSVVLQFVGAALLLEQRNIAMNSFIRDVVEKMRRNDIYTILVKGQGVAQCYERPLWRVAGDIDFYLSSTNYEKAKAYLVPLATSVEPENKGRLHLGMTIDSWVVELHGTMHSSISRRMNTVSDEVHYDIFFNGNVRSWNNNGVKIFLPSANNDVIIIFNHFISHFYGEGIGMRQICDWCRMLWKYNNEINQSLLRKRIQRMGLKNEWLTFAALAVDWLGMPAESMPLYNNSPKWSKKANKIVELIVETGNFGCNKDNSYRQNNSKWKEYCITIYRRIGEFGKIAKIFPVNACKFFVSYLFCRGKDIIKGDY